AFSLSRLLSFVRSAVGAGASVAQPRKLWAAGGCIGRGGGGDRGLSGALSARAGVRAQPADHHLSPGAAGLGGAGGVDRDAAFLCRGGRRGRGGLVGPCRRGGGGSAAGRCVQAAGSAGLGRLTGGKGFFATVRDTQNAGRSRPR